MIVNSVYFKCAIIMLPSFSASNYNIQNKFAQAIPYSSFTVEQPKLKNTMEYNTMTMEELVKENNEKIIQQIYKTLE